MVRNRVPLNYYDSTMLRIKDIDFIGNYSGLIRFGDGLGKRVSLKPYLYVYDSGEAVSPHDEASIPLPSSAEDQYPSATWRV